MPLLGHGIDIVEVSRIESFLADPEQDFVTASFTAKEQQLAGGTHLRPQYFAGRLAAKEAVVKALGTGFRGDICWTDVEIGRSDSGAPTVKLAGEALAVASALGVTRWHLSISHGIDYAVASAIAEAA